MYISQFKNHRPPYTVPQESALEWLAQAHCRFDESVDQARFAKLLKRYACSPEQIRQRSTALRDFTHDRPEDMQLFNPQSPATLSSRQAFFNEYVQSTIDKIYTETTPDFTSWIHVTCTGYSSPSVIQNHISRQRWGDQVRALHAYHMGCYAALPALRMARGDLDAEILHTELCTLHFDPINHAPEQLVVQSLFADGIIRYKCTNSRPHSGFRILDIKEVIVSGTTDQMSWEPKETGFQMSLGREVPVLIGEAIGNVVGHWKTPTTTYAIHPGGPRIIDSVKAALQLSEEQVEFSRQVLREFGNMSSATLPHIWMEMVQEIPSGTQVISMAFGPGLTLSASLMEKV
jgi:predicted naringenin-chalcone synthase